VKYFSILIFTIALVVGCNDGYVFSPQETYEIYRWSDGAKRPESFGVVNWKDDRLKPLIDALSISSHFERADVITGEGLVLVGDDQYIVVTNSALYVVNRKYLDSISIFKKSVDNGILDTIKVSYAADS